MYHKGFLVFALMAIFAFFGVANSAVDAKPDSPTTQRARELGLALIDAAAEGDKQTALDLIQEGADVSIVGDASNTALYFACTRDYMLDVVHELVERGAPVNTQCKGGFTALHQACDRALPKTAEYLLRMHADPNVTERSSGYTPLHIAVLQGGSHRKELVDLLLKHHADATIKGKDGKTAADLATEMKLGGIAKMLDGGK